MTELSTDPLTLLHVAISLISIFSGFVCLTQLRAGGVAEDRIQRLPHVPGAGVQAFVQDPTGNVVELNQPE